MIEVIITTKGGTHELGRIQIENLGPGGEFCDYSAKFGVDTGEGLAIYQRSFDRFPRKRYNVLALLKIALSTLEEQELTLDRDPDSPEARRRDASRPSDLVRRLFRSR